MEKQEDVCYMDTKPVIYVEAASARGIAVSPLTENCDVDIVILDKKPGYVVADFDGTGMLEIQKLDDSGIYQTDEEAVEQAMKDGIAIIPVKELPKCFERRYLGWIDTPENRKAIEDYCRKKDFPQRKAV